MLFAPRLARRAPVAPAELGVRRPRPWAERLNPQLRALHALATVHLPWWHRCLLRMQPLALPDPRGPLSGDCPHP